MIPLNLLHENIDILVPGQQVELNQLIAHLTDTAGIVSGCCKEVEISFKISGSQPQNIATHILRKLRRAQENTAPLIAHILLQVCLLHTPLLKKQRRLLAR